MKVMIKTELERAFKKLESVAGSYNWDGVKHSTDYNQDYTGSHESADGIYA